jgi:ubiquinone/menaquinone biosynthesis C-methylase UbiE
MNANKIKQLEIKGYTRFVRECRRNPKLKNIVIESYLDKDIKTAIERFGKDRNFNKALDIIKRHGGKNILDFGSGRCLASYNFAKLDYDVTALEMNTSEECGLGAIKNLKIRFNVVNGDAENMPFKEETFDIAYCNHVLHHAVSLNRMVKEVAKTIKRGGILIAQSEVMRPPLISDKRWRQNFLAAKCGANEHLYTTFQYIKAFKEAGLKNIRVLSNVTLDDIKKSKTLKGKFLYIFLRHKMIWSIFIKLFTYFGLPGSPIMIYGCKK